MFSIKLLGFEWVFNVCYGKCLNFVMVFKFFFYVVLFMLKICVVGLISSFVFRYLVGMVRMLLSWVYGRVEL